MGQCASRDDCVVGGHSCVDGVNSYSCDCDLGFQETDSDGDKVRGNIDDCAVFQLLSDSRLRNRREYSEQGAEAKLSVRSRDVCSVWCESQTSDVAFAVHTVQEDFAWIWKRSSVPRARHCA